MHMALEGGRLFTVLLLYHGHVYSSTQHDYDEE